MIMYAFFVILAIVGMSFLFYGISVDLTLWGWLGPEVGAPGFLPESLGWYTIAWFIMFFVMIGMMIRLKTSGCGKRWDKIPKHRGLFNFIYRDGIMMDILGDRRIGMGAFDVEGVGVVIDIGRKPSPGSVYRQGDKNIRLALQDINYTPNPLYTSIYTFFTELGFNNMEELQDVLMGYNPNLMVKVWDKLIGYEPENPEDRLVNNIQEMNKKELRANNYMWKQENKKAKKKQERLERKQEKIQRNIDDDVPKSRRTVPEVLPSDNVVVERKEPEVDIIETEIIDVEPEDIDKKIDMLPEPRKKDEDKHLRDYMKERF